MKVSYLVNSDVDVIGNEELTGVRHLARDEGAVGKHVPLRVDSGVDVCRGIDQV